MTRYVVKRILFFFPTLWGVATFVFLLGHALPGDPVDMMLGESAPVERRAELRHALGLDRPLAVQYTSYLRRAASGDLGLSLRTGRPVVRELAGAFPMTLELGLAALALACLWAFPLGVLAARWPGGAMDQIAAFISSAGLSFPSFFLGPVLLLFLAVQIPLFPISGADEPGSLILPAITLAMPLGALITRVLRSSLLEEQGQDYLRTARMKGVTEGRVFWVHALRTSALPVITVVGLQFGAVLTGAILTEKIFRWPGLGTLVLNAIASRDYPLVQGVVLLFAVVTLAANLITDLAYGWVDPRVKHG
jgi:peptide/nickel transport system permease protein